MKRVTKFKVFDSEEKKLMNVESIDWTNDLLTANEGDNSITDQIEMFDLIEFTGELDINKEEIYESDLIKFKNDFDEEFVAEVVFIESMFAVIWEDNLQSIAFIENKEKIGNRFLNPELLPT